MKSAIQRRRLLEVVLWTLVLVVPATAVTIHPDLTIQGPIQGDPDDMCIWIHPDDPGRSVIVTSDKITNTLFVYDLNGREIQAVRTPGVPGNVDVRYEFPLAGELVDIVAVNDRDNHQILVYVVDPSTGQLARIDDGTIDSGKNYGFCLFRSPTTGDFYAFTTAKSGWIQQFRLLDVGGRIGAERVRVWKLATITEGCVGDDEKGFVYFGEEDYGIWKAGGEPGDDTPGELIARVGEGGLTADVEGLTLYYMRGGEGYLIASSQGADSFLVYERAEPHRFLTSFKVDGVRNTDGIDVTNVPLGSRFPTGVFVGHNSRSGRRTVHVSSFGDIGLDVDTDYWRPRVPRVDLGVHFESVPFETGYRAFDYGEAPLASPTAEKPESKLRHPRSTRDSRSRPTTRRWSRRS